MKALLWESLYRRVADNPALPAGSGRLFQQPEFLGVWYRGRVEGSGGEGTFYTRPWAPPVAPVGVREMDDHAETFCWSWAQTSVLFILLVFIRINSLLV